MTTKYTLDEIKQMLLEPSFDWLAFWDWGNVTVENIGKVVEEAIAHHEKLDKANDAEGF